MRGRKAAQERALQVHGDDAIPPGLVGFEKVALRPGQASIVDQDVQRTKALEGRLEHRVHLRLACDVGRDGERRAALCGDGLRRVLGRLSVDVVDDHLRAFGAKALRDGGANAVTCAGD